MRPTRSLSSSSKAGASGAILRSAKAALRIKLQYSSISSGPRWSSSGSSDPGSKPGLRLRKPTRSVKVCEVALAIEGILFRPDTARN